MKLNRLGQLMDNLGKISRNDVKTETARLIRREKRFDCTNMTKTDRSTEQDRNSGQLFRPSWGSSALCSEVLELFCARNARCHIMCFGVQGDQSVTIGVSKRKK